MLGAGDSSGKLEGAGKLPDEPAESSTGLGLRVPKEGLWTKEEG